MTDTKVIYFDKHKIESIDEIIDVIYFPIFESDEETKKMIKLYLETELNSSGTFIVEIIFK